MQGVPCAVVEAFAKGGLGATDLAARLLRRLKTNPSPEFSRSMRLMTRLRRRFEGCDRRSMGPTDVALSDERAREAWTLCGVGIWAVAGLHCEDAVLADGRSQAHGCTDGMDAEDQRMFRLSAGAGFVVAVAGNMMLMPGLAQPSAGACQSMWMRTGILLGV